MASATPEHRGKPYQSDRASEGSAKRRKDLRQPFLVRRVGRLRATIHRVSRRLSGDCSEKDSGPARGSTGKPTITRATAPAHAMLRTYSSHLRTPPPLQMCSMDPRSYAAIRDWPNEADARARVAASHCGTWHSPRSLVGLVWHAGIHRTFWGWLLHLPVSHTAHAPRLASRFVDAAHPGAACSRRPVRNMATRGQSLPVPAATRGPSEPLPASPRIAIARAFGKYRPAHSRAGLGAVAALGGQGRQVAQGQMAVDPLVETAKLLGTTAGPGFTTTTISASEGSPRCRCKTPPCGTKARHPHP